jgi:ABC-type multidrug transport system ATPase subunit
MEEADALCSSIAIMARGRLKCLGTPTHLKAKYGSGFKISLSLSDDDDGLKVATIAHIVEFIQTNISRHASLVNSINSRFAISLPSITDGRSTRVSAVFKLMEGAKTELGIREWAISMASLEDVFIAAVSGDRV